MSTVYDLLERLQESAPLRDAELDKWIQVSDVKYFSTFFRGEEEEIKEVARAASSIIVEVYLNHRNKKVVPLRRKSKYCLLLNNFALNSHLRSIVFEALDSLNNIFENAIAEEGEMPFDEELGRLSEHVLVLLMRVTNYTLKASAVHEFAEHKTQFAIQLLIAILLKEPAYEFKLRCNCIKCLLGLTQPQAYFDVDQVIEQHSCNLFTEKINFMLTTMLRLNAIQVVSDVLTEALSNDKIDMSIVITAFTDTMQTIMNIYKFASSDSTQWRQHILLSTTFLDGAVTAFIQTLLTALQCAMERNSKRIPGALLYGLNLSFKFGAFASYHLGEAGNELRCYCTCFHDAFLLSLKSIVSNAHLSGQFMVLFVNLMHFMSNVDAFGDDRRLIEDDLIPELTTEQLVQTVERFLRKEVGKCGLPFTQAWHAHFRRGEHDIMLARDTTTFEMIDSLFNTIEAELGGKPLSSAAKQSQENEEEEEEEYEEEEQESQEKLRQKEQQQQQQEQERLKATEMKAKAAAAAAAAEEEQRREAERQAAESKALAERQEAEVKALAAKKEAEAKALAERQAAEIKVAAEKKAAAAAAKALAQKQAAEAKALAEKQAKEAKIAAEKQAAEAKAFAERQAAEAKAAEEKKAAEAKAAEERRIAEAKAAEAKALAAKQAAEAKALAEKRAAEAKAAEEKKLAELKAAQAKALSEKKAAEAKRIEEEKAAAEAKALAERQAAEAKALAEKQAVEAKKAAEKKAAQLKAEAEKKAAEAKAAEEKKKAQIRAVEAQAAAEKREAEAKALAARREAEAKALAAQREAEARALAERKEAEAKALAEKLAAEAKAEIERQAEEEARVFAERQAAEAKALAERQAQEAKIAAEHKAAVAKALAEKQAAEANALAEKQAKEAKAAAEKQAAEAKVAEERKAAAEAKAIAERKEAEAKALAERQRLEAKALAERQAAEEKKIAESKAAAAKAAAERREAAARAALAEKREAFTNPSALPNITPGKVVKDEVHRPPMHSEAPTQSSGPVPSGKPPVVKKKKTHAKDVKIYKDDDDSYLTETQREKARNPITGASGELRLLGNIPSLKKPKVEMKMSIDDAAKLIQVHQRRVVSTDSNDISGVDPTILCALTSNVMKNPVSSPYGHTFEREAIISWLKENGSICPITGKPLTIEELEPNPVIAARIMQQLLSQNIQTASVSESTNLYNF